MGKKSKRNVHAGTGDTAPEASSGGPPGGPGPSGPSASGPAPAADGDVKKVKAKFKKLELEPSTSNKQTPGGKKTLQPASNPQATQQPLPVFAPPPQVQPQWPRAPPPAVTSALSAPAPWGPRGQSPASQVAPQAQPTAQPAPAPWGQAQAPALQVAPQAHAQQVAPQAPAPAQVSPQVQPPTPQPTAQSAPAPWGRTQAPALQVVPQAPTPAQVTPQAQPTAAQPVNPPQPAGGKGKKGKGKKGSGDAATAATGGQVLPPPVPSPSTCPSPGSQASSEPSSQASSPPPSQSSSRSSSQASTPSASQKLVQKSYGLKIPKRGKPEKKVGQPILIETNFLPLTISTKQNGVHYDVTIVPDKPKGMLVHVMNKFIKNKFPGRNPAFDGQKNLYSCGNLPIPPSGVCSDIIPRRRRVGAEGNPTPSTSSNAPTTQIPRRRRVGAEGNPTPSTSSNAPTTQIPRRRRVSAEGDNPTPSTSSNYTAPTTQISMEEEGRREPMRFEVTVKWAAFIDFGSLNTYMKEGSSQDAPQVAINCLDVVLRHAPLARFVKVGRSFFSQPRGTVVQLGGGLEMWYGVFQSAVLGWKPFINVDIAHKGFPCKQNLVDLIQELAPRNVDVRRGPQPLPYDVIDSLKKFIKSLKVEFEIPGNSASKRTYRVNDVKQPPGELRFAGEGGRMTTVTEYFRTERRYIIKYPHLPCVWVGKRDGEIKICYPVELCTVLPGQVIVRKMDGNQTTKMIQCSAAPADERKRKIMDAVNSMKYNQDPTLKEFGLKVSEVFEQVPARIIPAPSLQYQGKTITPRCGKWFAGRFITAAKLKYWTIVVLDRVDGRQIELLITSLINMANKVGMEIDRPNIKNIRVQDLLGVFEEAAKLETQLVMVIVSEYGNQYAQVKQIAELRYGVLTQCVKSRTVFKMNDNTASQLLLKINAKLDQTNHALTVPGGPPCLQKPCMIVGADVTHPSPGQMDEPSLAAVVASHDPKAFKYNITLRLQPPKVEIISDLAAMMKQQLMFFFSKTKQKPQHIIFFRDGVSEGQFETVLNSELMAIRSACSQLNADYKPKITFFVVQKRHHTRFFPTNPKDGDRNFNVPVGTCVDTQITHPTELDFYLLSHESIKGTARPTHYHRLWDDADMKESEVEELAFHLCHMFTRCNRSVSYPAPTYYAHLAALRAKVYIDGKHPNMERLPTEQTMLNVTDFIRRERPMYFV